MTLTTEMRQTAAQQTIDALRSLGRDDLIAHITIDWKKGFTSRMGDALYARGPVRRSTERYRIAGVVCRVRFSIPLWHRATEGQRRQTVIHEVCHLVAAHEAYLRGTKVSSSHGPEWKRVMLRAGVTPKRCHNVDNSGLSKSRKITVTCRCGNHEVTPMVAGRILSGGTYSCGKCRGKLTVDASALTGSQIIECKEAARKADQKRAQGRRRRSAGRRAALGF